MESLVGRPFGPYQIVQALGRGGMAVVYKAYHQSKPDQYVAIKVLSPQPTDDADFIKRFEMEARASTQLKHPNIVKVYDVGKQNGYQYIVMEYLPGKSLDVLISQRKAISFSRSVKIISQIGAALDYAHSLGYIHRDIKPSNIMIDENDHATLTDFGIAQIEGARSAKTNALSGTPAYMAPELIEHSTVDRRVDVYALGLVAYEILAGQAAFQGDTTRILYAQVHDNPPSLRRINSRVSPLTEQVIGCALSKRSSQRYASAGGFATAYREAVSRSSIASPIHLSRPVVAGFIVGIILIGLILFGIVAEIRKSPTPTPNATTSVTRSATQASSSSGTVLPTARISVTPTLAQATPTTPAKPTKRLDLINNRLNETNLATTKSAVITETQIPFSAPVAVWHPDGSKILLTGISSSGCYGGTTCPEDQKIINFGTILLIQGNTTKSITSQDDFRDAIWSPDGLRIAAHHINDDGTVCPVILGSDGTGVRKLSGCQPDDHPRYWSVDGKWLIVWSERGNKLYGYDVDGTQHLPIDQIANLQVYDERYYPWLITASPTCKGASFWDCE